MLWLELHACAPSALEQVPKKTISVIYFYLFIEIERDNGSFYSHRKTTAVQNRH
jgi:hypothetical protein